MLRRMRRLLAWGFLVLALFLCSGLVTAGEDLSLTLSQGTIEQGKVTVNGTFSGSLEGRQLLLAVYDIDGKMTEIVAIAPSGEQGQWSQQLNAPSAISGLKAFLLDTNAKPVLDSQGLHRSAMVLKIGSAGTYSGYYEEVQVLPSVTGEIILEDMQVRGNLTIAAAQKVILKGNSLVSGTLKLQKTSGSPTEVVLLGNSHVNQLENTGAAGAVFLSLTTIETSVLTVLSQENLQLINTSVGTLTLEARQAQQLKFGMSSGEVEQVFVKAKSGATPTGATLSVQVEGYTNPVTKFQTEMTAQNLLGSDVFHIDGEVVNNMTSEIPVTLQGISQWGVLNASASLTADSSAVIQSLTSSADMEVKGVLNYGKAVKLTDKEAPDFTLLGSGTSTLTGTIDVLTLGGTVTGVLTDDNGTAYSVGSVILQSEATVNPSALEFNLLNIPNWNPSFSAMPGGSIGGLTTLGSGQIGSVLLMQGIDAPPPPVIFGSGLLVGSLQFGNGSSADVTFGIGSTLGSLINQSPVPSTLSFPPGFSPSQLIGQYADTNQNNRITVRIGNEEQVLERNTTIVPISLKIRTGPERFGWVGERSDQFLRQMTVELQYQLLNSSTGIASETMTNTLHVNSDEFSVTPSVLAQTGSQNIQIKHNTTGLTVSSTILVYESSTSVVRMAFTLQPYVIRTTSGSGILAGGKISGVYVDGQRFDIQIYDMDGVKVGPIECAPRSFDSRSSGSQRIIATYNGASASAYIDIGSAKTWGIGLRQSALDEIATWEARINDYMDPDKMYLSSFISSAQLKISQSTSEREIINELDFFRIRLRSLRTQAERTNETLRTAKLAAIQQIMDYWPAKPEGGTYGSLDYSSVSQRAIENVRIDWRSQVESAEILAQIEGTTENPGMVARAKTAIDAIARKSDDLNTTLSRFGNTPILYLTRSEGLSEVLQAAMVRDAVYRDLLLLGGEPSWKVVCVRNSETSYSIALEGAESAISTPKAFTVQWNIWETRGTVLSELYGKLKVEYPNWTLAADVQTATINTLVDAVNMTESEKEAFAFFAYHGIIRGTAQVGTKLQMSPNEWMTRGQYTLLLERLMEHWMLNVSSAFVDPVLDGNALLASATGDEVEVANTAFVTTIKPLLRLVASYEDLPGALNDASVQTILLQGQIDLPAREESRKNIVVQKNAHLTIHSNFGLTLKEQAKLLLQGSLTNFGELHLDPDTQFVSVPGAMLNNQARFVSFGGVVLEGVLNPNLHNIEYHSLATRMNVLEGLYEHFREGYGFITPNAADVENYALIYADWNEVQAQETMAWILCNGIYDGTLILNSNDKVLAANARLNRAEIAEVLYAFALKLPNGLTTTSSPVVFTDVDDTHTFYSAVTELSKAGVIEGTQDGFFRPNYNIETTWNSWGSELENLLNRLVAASGYADSSISLIRILPGENPVYRNKNFVNEVSVYSLDDPRFTDNQGGEVRFINCKFSNHLKINLVDISYMVIFDNVVLHNNEVYTTTPDPTQMTAWGYTPENMMPDSYNRDIRVSLNGVPSGTTVLSDVNTEVTMNAVGTFFLNGAQIQSTGSIAEGQSISALTWKECEAQHAPDYSGDHSDCVRDPNAENKVPADQYRVLEVRDQVSTITLPNPDPTNILVNFGRVVMNENCPENVRLNFGTYDTIPSIFRINGGGQNPLILNGSLTGNLEVVGHTDLREITVSGTIDIGTWWQNTAVNIGSHSVRLLGHGDKAIAITADNNAVVLVPESGQPYTVNYVSETDRGFQIGLPHVYGNQGDCGVYIGTENAADYDFVVSQGSWNEATHQMVYTPISMTEETFTGQTKIHLTPVNQRDITDYNQLALSTTWRNGTKTITVILQQIPIKVNYLNRSGFAMSLYGEFRNVYGLTDATDTELAAMSTTYTDWSPLSVEEKTAMAFMLKHQLLPEIVEGESRYVKPQEQVSRGQAAQTLYTLANALQQVGTYPNGLDLTKAPNATFSDLPTGDLGNAILNLAKAGVLSPDDAGFRPSEILNDRDLRDWFWRLQENLGPAVSLESSFEVLYNQVVRVENKVFNQEVKVFSNHTMDISKDPWAPENQGGEIRFINCDFQGGLTLQLGEVGYQVSLDNVQLIDQTVRVAKHDTKNPNPYMNSVRVQINGVAPGTIIDSMSPSGMFNVAVSSGQAGYFVLNGIRVESVATMPQNGWYQASTWKQCSGHHEPNYTGNHTDCLEDPWNEHPTSAVQYMVMEVEGQVVKVTPQVGQEINYTSVAQYQIRDDNAVATVELHMQNLAPTINRLYVQAGKATTWKLVGSSSCNTMVTGNADLTQFSNTGSLRLNNWYNENNPISQMQIGSHAVILEGDNNKSIELFASNGASIWSSMQPLNMQLHSPTTLYDLGSPHVFGDNGNFGIYLGVVLPANTGTYNITLEKPVWSDAEQKTNWEAVPYTLQSFSDDTKTHLTPIDPMAIQSPWDVRMTVEWMTGNDTITVIYEFLPYQQPLANRADVAKTILLTYTEMDANGRVSEYGLQLPTYEEKTQYAALYLDWQEMIQDADTVNGMALVFKNGLMSPMESLVKPWQSMTRLDLVKVLHALTQNIETSLQKTLATTYPSATYEDIDQSHPDYVAIMYLLQRGILPDWNRIEPDIEVTQGDLWDWNRRLQDAFGKLESNRTEITLDGSDLTISNRVFTAPVTISTTMTKNVEQPLSNREENWGGRLELPQCEFLQGLTIVLNEVPFEVSMMGSPVDGVVYVQATNNGLAWKFDPDWVLNLSGVASGTVVTCEGNVSVTSGEPNGQFNLQGNLVIGSANLQEKDYFGANLSWICDDFGTHGDTNNHSSCDLMLRHQMLGIHGLVKEVLPGADLPINMPRIQTFELWKTNQDVALKFPTETPYPFDSIFDLNLGGWSETIAFLRVSGWVDNAVNAWGRVDISNLQVNAPYETRVLTYRPGADVIIGSKTIVLAGFEGSEVTLHADHGAVIDARMAGNNINVKLKDMAGFGIPYDVCRVDWNKTPDNEWVITTNSVDESISYILHKIGTDDSLTALNFDRYAITKEGETIPSLTALVPASALDAENDYVQVTLQKSGISIVYYPFLDTTPTVQGEIVTTYAELQTAATTSDERDIVISQNMTVPDKGSQSWSIEVYRTVVIPEGVTLTLASGSQMAYSTIQNKGSIVVQGPSENLGGGYLQGGTITDGSLVSGGGSASVGVDEIGLREALKFNLATVDISIDKPLALSGTLDFARSAQQPPRRIFLFAALTALQDNTALVLYQGDLLKNEISTGHNFFETDGVTPIPDAYYVLGQFRVFHWNNIDQKWIATSGEILVNV